MANFKIELRKLRGNMSGGAQEQGGDEVAHAPMWCLRA
jgi:hypothetical protein